MIRPYYTGWEIPIDKNVIIKLVSKTNKYNLIHTNSRSKTVVGEQWTGIHINCTSEMFGETQEQIISM